MEHRRNTGGRVGHNAEQALHAAKTELLFHSLEQVGMVKLDVRDDYDADLSWLDQTDDQMGGGFERQAKEQKQRAHDYGCYGIVGMYRINESDDWDEADSVWGFIDDDWKDSGYDIDVMATTIDALKNRLRSRCKDCRR